MLTNFALIDEESWRLPEARERHEEALRIYEDLGLDRGVVAVQLNLANVAKLQSRLPESKELLGLCLPFFQDNDDEERHVAALQNQAEIAWLEGDHEDAMRLLREALEISRLRRDLRETATIVLWFGITCLALKRFEAALRLLLLAQAMMDRTDSSFSSANATRLEDAMAEARGEVTPEMLLAVEGETASMNYEQTVAEALRARDLRLAEASP